VVVFTSLCRTASEVVSHVRATATAYWAGAFRGQDEVRNQCVPPPTATAAVSKTDQTCKARAAADLKRK
jgi:hypothetical protein